MVKEVINNPKRIGQSLMEEVALNWALTDEKQSHS